VSQLCKTTGLDCPHPADCEPEGCIRRDPVLSVTTSLPQHSVKLSLPLTGDLVVNGTGVTIDGYSLTHAFHVFVFDELAKTREEAAGEFACTVDAGLKKLAAVGQIMATDRHWDGDHMVETVEVIVPVRMVG
jgi:hypothetical protein